MKYGPKSTKVIEQTNSNDVLHDLLKPQRGPEETYENYHTRRLSAHKLIEYYLQRRPPPQDTRIDNTVDKV